MVKWLFEKLQFSSFYPVMTSILSYCKLNLKMNYPIDVYLSLKHYDIHTTETLRIKYGKSTWRILRLIEIPFENYFFEFYSLLLQTLKRNLSRIEHENVLRSTLYSEIAGSKTTFKRCFVYRKLWLQ